MDERTRLENGQQHLTLTKYPEELHDDRPALVSATPLYQCLHCFHSTYKIQNTNSNIQNHSQSCSQLHHQPHFKISTKSLLFLLDTLPPGYFPPGVSLSNPLELSTINLFDCLPICPPSVDSRNLIYLRKIRLSSPSAHPNTRFTFWTPFP